MENFENQFHLGNCNAVCMGMKLFKFYQNISICPGLFIPKDSFAIADSKAINSV